MARLPRSPSNRGAIREAIAQKGKEALEGFVSGATGGTVGNIRINTAGAADTGVDEAGRQSPPSGDPQKDIVNAIRDLQSDFGGQRGTLKSINQNLQTQLTALDAISKQIGMLNQTMANLSKDIKEKPPGGSGGGLFDVLGGLGGGSDKPQQSKPAPKGKPGAVPSTVKPSAATAGGALARGGAGMLGKLIPGVGLAAGAYGAYDAYQRGDLTGALLQGGAGLASLIPGIGTVASLALSGADVLRGVESKVEEFAPGEKEALIAAQKQAAISDTRPPLNFSGDAFDMSQDFTRQQDIVAAQTPAMLELARKEQERKEESKQGDKNVISFTAKEMVFKADFIKFEQLGGAAGGYAGSAGGYTGGGTGAGYQPQTQAQVSQLPSIPAVPQELGGAAPSAANLPTVPLPPPELGGPRAQQGSAGGGNIDQILQTIRNRESRGNYQAQSRSSTASGAYQFIDGTWQGLTKQFGIGQQYKRAVDAPKEVQDAVARAYVQDILQKNKGDVSKVPLVWYTGNAKGQMSEKALAANKGLTGEMYQSKWMADFAQTSGQAAGGATQVSGPPGVSGAGVNQAQFAQSGVSPQVAGLTSPAGGTGALPSGVPAGFAPNATRQGPAAGDFNIPGAASVPKTPGYGGGSESAAKSQERGAERVGQNGMLPDSALVPIGGRHRLSRNAADAYQRMVQAAQQEGITWSVTDSYRTYDEQVAVARKKGLYSQGGLAATPGRSNHGWGNAVDLAVGGAGSKQHQWLVANAGKYGFKTIAREPWHWEYVGGSEAVSTPQIAGGPGSGGQQGSREGAPAAGMYGGPLATLSGGEQRQMERAMRGGTAVGYGGMTGGGGLASLGGAVGSMFGGPLGGMLGGMLGAGVGSLFDSMVSTSPTTGAQAMQKSFETSSYTPPPSQTTVVSGGEGSKQGPSQDTSRSSFDVSEPYISAKDLTRIFGITYS